MTHHDVAERWIAMPVGTSSLYKLLFFHENEGNSNNKTEIKRLHLGNIELSWTEILALQSIEIYKLCFNKNTLRN